MKTKYIVVDHNPENEDNNVLGLLGKGTAEVLNFDVANKIDGIKKKGSSVVWMVNLDQKQLNEIICKYGPVMMELHSPTGYYILRINCG